MAAQMASLHCTTPAWRAQRAAPSTRSTMQHRRTTPHAVTVRASAASSSAAPAVSGAVERLRKAAADSSVPPRDVFAALRDLEQAKMQPGEDWGTIIGGTASPGNRWRLVFTSGTKQVQEALKGAGKGGGSYFPLTACQRWDASKSEIENGIFLGRLAALTFKGPYKMDGKILAFDFDTLKLRLGGWETQIPLKGKVDPSTFKRGKESPFFVFFYVDQNIICARGRGGGIAVWARTTPQWELQAGVV